MKQQEEKLVRCPPKCPERRMNRCNTCYHNGKHELREDCIGKASCGYPYDRNGICVCPSCISVEPEPKEACVYNHNRDCVNNERQKHYAQHEPCCYSIDVQQKCRFFTKPKSEGEQDKDTRQEKTDCEYYQGTEKDLCYMFYKADCRNCSKYTPKKPTKQPEQEKDVIIELICKSGICLKITGDCVSDKCVQVKLLKIKIESEIKKPEGKQEKCPECKGVRQILKRRRTEGGKRYKYFMTCPTCKGTGLKPSEKGEQVNLNQRIDQVVTALVCTYCTKVCDNVFKCTKWLTAKNQIELLIKDGITEYTDLHLP